MTALAIDGINVHKNLLRSKKTAITADRTLNIDQVLRVNKNSGYVLPVGTPICRNCRQKLLSPQHIEHGKDFTDETWTENCPDLDTNLHSIVQLSTEITEKTQEQFFESSQEHEEDPVSSQSTSSMYMFESSEENLGSSQCSSYIPNESRVKNPLRALNSFLAEVDISPVKKIQSNLLDACDRTKRRYISKAKTCLNAMLDTICPGERDNLFELITPSAEREDNALDEAIQEAYNSTETWTLQRQLLSILAVKKSYNYVNHLIPGVTRYRYNIAKKHGMQYGIGAPMPSISNFRKAIDPARVESFIDFITSCNIIQDMPFGEKTMKLSTGKVIPTPNVIRCIAPAAIVRQYDQYCDENSIDPLGHSTMYRILQACPASIQKSVEGLDYFIVEGGRAFADLNSVVSQLQIPKSDSDKILKDLSDSKRYLKCDYKVHLETKSDIPDHCLSFALSDQDKLLQNDCLEHSHNKGCKNCQILTNVLQTIQQKLNDLKDKVDENLFDNMLFKTSKAVGDILDWKKHILRSKNQARAKSNIISELSEKRAFIMVDWAMKFLPRKYREGQTDWFAKRGINWHIAVCLTKVEEGLQTLTFVHFFANPIPQDSVTSASILCDIAKEVVKLKPEITNVSFYSDNAGCYKSTLTIALLYANLGPLITSYDFCEAQDGKGPCDRKSSHIKSEIKRYVNEGHDVLDAKGMKQAIDSRGNKTYMCKVVEECESLKPTVKSIPNITSYTNFSYSESGLTIWRGFGIGKGMHIPWSKVTDLSQIVTMTLKITNTSENISFRDIKIQHIKPQEINQQEQIELDISEDDSAAISNPENSGGIFCCPVSGCTKSFLKHKSLEDHIIIGNCQFQSKCQSTSDTYKNLYALKVTQAVGHCFNLSMNAEETIDTNTLMKGWALKSRKAHVTFSTDQKKFLNEKFQIGQITGKKEDPVSVSLEMQSAVLNGKRRFKREEFLVPQQIASYFSRYSRQINSKYNDGIAAKSENETSIITQEVLANINADT